MRKQEEPYLTGNLTAMIDVVFQLIIFFVCTVSMQEKAIDDSIRLTMAPNGAPVRTKDPREVNIDVDKRGRITINRTPLSQGMLTVILKKAIADSGGNPDYVPIIIRGDEKVTHETIKTALDACSAAGIIKVRFAAMKERGS
jgi:biopolymer transport protein ExbD